MALERYDEYLKENRIAASRFSDRVRKGNLAVTVIHHNDADGIAAAAALSYALGRMGMSFRLLPVEKVHEPIIERIHASSGASGGDVVVYADLGGQSSGLIGRHAGSSPQVLILDHHLPGGEVPGNVIHLNPELLGISGDADVSGAAVCALFAKELLKEAPTLQMEEEVLPELLGVVGAVGDGQVQGGSATGINRMLLDAVLKKGEITDPAAGCRIPRFLNKTAPEVVEMLNLLGSIGFYSGSAATGVDFLLGRDSGDALRVLRQLEDLKKARFRKEEETVRNHGLEGSKHFQWLNVKDRFVPMGVKAIGLFLEYLIEKALAAPDKYLIGFQHLPAEMPGIGRLERPLTKVSARMHPKLKESIQQGRLPDYMDLIPHAAALVKGTADGCHRFKAAAVIGRGQEADFLDALERALAKENAG